jgi:hypothetical protein
MTGDDARRLLARLLAGSGGAWGLALLTRPDRVAGALCPELPRSRYRVVRLLGLRHAVQNAAVLAAPAGPVLRAAAAVDLLHAATMVPLLRSAPHRRAALVSGGVAAVSAALAATLAPRSPRR